MRRARTPGGRYDGPDGRLNELTDIFRRIGETAAAQRNAGGRPSSEAVRAGHAVRRELRAEQRRRDSDPAGGDSGD